MFNDIRVWFLSVIGLVSFSLYWVGKSDSQPTKKRLPPLALPSSHVLSTMYRLMSANAPMYLLQQAREYGDVYCLPFASSKPLVVVCDPQLAKQILLQHPEKPFWGYSFADDATQGDNFFSANGMRWNHPRRATSAAFRETQYFRTVCNRVVSQWIQHRENDYSSNIDLVYEMQYISIQVILEAGFGTLATKKEIDQIVHSFDSIFMAQRELARNSLHYLFPSLFHLQRKAKEGRAYLRTFATQILHSAQNESSAPLLLDLIRANEAYMSDEERARDIIVFLATGYDTTASTLSWTLLEIAKNPHYQIALQHQGSEIALRNILRESMRMYPVGAFGSLRLLSKDVTTQQYFLPKGSNVITCIYAIHRNEKHFPNPDRFSPDRWDSIDSDKNAFMPFAVGPRNCIGQALAMIELDVVLTRICKHFRISVIDEGSHDFWVVYKPQNVRLALSSLPR